MDIRRNVRDGVVVVVAQRGATADALRTRRRRGGRRPGPELVKNGIPCGAISRLQALPLGPLSGHPSLGACAGRCLRGSTGSCCPAVLRRSLVPRIGELGDQIVVIENLQERPPALGRWVEHQLDAAVGHDDFQVDIGPLVD